MKFVFLFLIPAMLLAETPTPKASPSPMPVVSPKPSPSPQPVVFNVSKSACSLLNGKLSLANPRTWEDCSYALLQLAVDLNQGKEQAQKESMMCQAMLRAAQAPKPPEAKK